MATLPGQTVRKRAIMARMRTCNATKATNIRHGSDCAAVDDLEIFWRGPPLQAFEVGFVWLAFEDFLFALSQTPYANTIVP